MCLLLTLLAVPVFYSLFDDMKEMHFLSDKVFDDAPRRRWRPSRCKAEASLMRGISGLLVSALASLCSLRAQDGAPQARSAAAGAPVRLPPRIGVITEARLTCAERWQWRWRTTATSTARASIAKSDCYNFIGAQGAYDPHIGADQRNF